MIIKRRRAESEDEYDGLMGEGVEDCLVLVCKLILYLCSCKDHPVA